MPFGEDGAAEGAVGEAGEAVGSVDCGVTESCASQAAAAEGCFLEEGGTGEEGTEEECECMTDRRGDVDGRGRLAKREYSYQMDGNT